MRDKKRRERDAGAERSMDPAVLVVYSSSGQDCRNWWSVRASALARTFAVFSRARAACSMMSLIINPILLPRQVGAAVSRFLNRGFANADVSRRTSTLWPTAYYSSDASNFIP